MRAPGRRELYFANGCLLVLGEVVEAEDFEVVTSLGVEVFVSTEMQLGV